MKSFRKPLFWILMFFLVLLVCCAAALGGYVIWGRPLINHPAQASAPIDSASREATTSVLGYQMNQYYLQNNMGKWMETADQAVALDPDNYQLHYYRANMFQTQAEIQKGLVQHMEILAKGLDDINRAILIDPSNGDGYSMRAIILYDFGEGYPFRADREYYYRLALENINYAVPLKSPRNLHPERYQVKYEVYLQNCENALIETRQLEKTISPENVVPPTLESLYESVYACQGDYQKAYDYHLASLKKTEKTEDRPAVTAIYLYQLGKVDEAVSLINTALSAPGAIKGPLYFVRAAIEYDHSQYAQALQDADMADRNSWSAGTFSAYFEGLEAVRKGQKDEAINKLQYAEATLETEFNFAIIRSRAELEKIGAKTLVVTPSVHFSATPMPQK